MSGDREPLHPKPCYLSPTLTAHSTSTIRSNVAYRERTLTGTRVVSVCVVGDGSTGKTSFIHRLATNAYNAHTISTVGGSTYSVRHQDPIGQSCLLNIRDTSGEETFRSIMPIFFRGVEFAVLVFDLTNHASFLSTVLWANTVRKLRAQHLQTMLLCGTKLDLVLDDSSQRAVTAEEGHRMAAELGCAGFFEVSAKTGAGATAIKDAITEMAMKEEDDHPHLLPDSRVLTLVPQSRRRKGRCCCAK